MPLVLDGTNGVSGVDGTASNPAIEGTDSNTGIFYPAADTVAIGTGGTEALRVNSSQVLSLVNNPTLSGGTANGVAYLNASKVLTTGSALSFNGTTLSSSGFQATTGAPGFSVSNQNTNAARIEFANTGGVLYVGLDNSSGGLGGPYTGNVWHSGNYALVFGTNNLERARITSGGQLLVGSSTANVNLGATGLQVTSAETALIVQVTNASGQAVRFFSSTSTQAGFITVSGAAASYNSVSDYRMKENVVPMVGALGKVMALNPVTYDWKPEFQGTKLQGQGFIAHELAEVVPDAVTGEKDAVDADGKPQYQGIDTRFLVATLTAALQELNAKVEAQAAEIAALKGNA